jgi:hypothetical protein
MIKVARQGKLIRFWSVKKKPYGWTEIAYISFKISGLKATMEFPSDWHEDARLWFTFGFGLFSLGFSFPWKWVVPDEYQCSGPTYGFSFFGDLLFIYYGKSKGTRDDPMKAFNMPWSWGVNKEHKILSEPETHDFAYMLRNGEFQKRKATIRKESRLWTRYWIPWRKYYEYIDIQFDQEVGEKSGSWKGGVLGMSHTMLPGEEPVDTLRRLEYECFIRKEKI